MKKIYVIPDIELVEFEIVDIITHSVATGDDSGGRGDESYDDGDFGGIFNGRSATFNIGGRNYTIGG